MADIIIGLASPLVEIAIKKLTDVATTEFVNIKDEVEKLNNSFTEIKTLLGILEGNPPMDSSTASPLKNWLERLRAASYDMEDLIDCWTTEYQRWKMKQQQVQKFHLPFCAFKFLFLSRELSKLREITSRIDAINRDGQRYKSNRTMIAASDKSHSKTSGTGPVQDRLVVSRGKDKEKIIEQLTTEKKAGRGTFSFIPIVGIGGLGKTTLAQLVFNDENVDRYFDFRIWVFVGNEFDMERIFREILVSLVRSLNVKRRQATESLKDMIKKKESQPETPVDPTLLAKLQTLFKDASPLDLNQLPSPSDPNSLLHQNQLPSPSDLYSLPHLKDLYLHYSNSLDRLQTRPEIIDYTPLSLAQLETRILELLTQKRFLLVLDDLWNHKDEELEPLVKVLNHGACGSKVLVTSRLKEVSNIMDSASPYSLQCLGDHESWWLFKKLAFKEDSNLIDSEFEKCGREIVGMCQGLPLATKQMAGLLRGKELGEWENVAKSQTWKARVEDTQILPALRLSYNHLPSPDHKQCFSLCSLFPKSYLYEKDELVKLWMAEGFIQPPTHGVGERTEDIGSRYFKELSDRFFFECSAEDNTKYRMHDLIHDLAQSVSSPFFCQVKDMKDFDEKSRHVSLLQEQLQKPTIEIVNKSKKLRTLLLPVQHLQLRAFGKGQGEIIHSLMYMRVLDMSSSTVVTLPDSIGRLKLLRYLDLSTTEIRKLPDSVCNLFNLETLKLLRCPWIFNLPKNLKNLVNLRHLELDEIFWFKTLMLPRSMGCLTSLHNLHKFPVSCETGNKLEELKNMVYLRGTLHISKLENAVNAGEANLKGKEMIEKVVYEWSSNDVNFHDEAAAKQVLEDLEPHPKALKELQICHYKGTEFPRWMGLLTNLVSIYLNHCTRSKVLDLRELHKLEQVRLKNMLELEDWNGDFESLKILRIVNCPKLKSCSHRGKTLDFLKIKRCESLEHLLFSCWRNPMSITLVDNPVLMHWTHNCESFFLCRIFLYWKFERGSELKIINCPKLHESPDNYIPKKLEASGCNSEFKIHPFLNMEHLALDACSAHGSLVGLPPRDVFDLRFLVISNISNLICLPDWGLPELGALYVRDCKALEYLSNQNKSFQGFTSLTTLSIHNCPKLVTLPVEGLPTSLKYLSIGSCARLMSFGPADVLQKLDSLHDLYIEDCPALQSLPEGGLPTSLLHLSIQRCPSLVERCGEEDGDWPKIKHIPDLEMKMPSTETATSSPSSSSTAWYHLRLRRPNFKRKTVSE
ncbi:putative disease resistance protein RGA3 isoform X1 [Malus sylvestris]|uniref:putative disease resistance protein RGA3 isoform X1 n=1 Tax=Malus sylvestris TaxID=3752 RepID=UPI0021AC45F1|nr:putative disease resistance protein RGA3 isoform X1 [Malus sylvestris]XP_050135464.1 putative disease resistance protein RGA3 isoform X1 [Malus sylvestris]